MNQDILSLLSSTPIQELQTSDFGNPGVKSGGSLPAGPGGAPPANQQVSDLLMQNAQRRSTVAARDAELSEYEASVVDRLEAARTFRLPEMSRVEKIFGGRSARRRNKITEARLQVEMMNAALPALAQIVEERRQLYAPTSVDRALVTATLKQQQDEAERTRRQVSADLLESTVPGLSTSPHWQASKLAWTSGSETLKVPDQFGGLDVVRLNQVLTAAESLGSEAEVRKALAGENSTTVNAAVSAWKVADGERARLATQGSTGDDPKTHFYPGAYKTALEFRSAVEQQIAQFEKDPTIPKSVEFYEIQTGYDRNGPITENRQRTVIALPFDQQVLLAVDALGVPMEIAAKPGGYPFLMGPNETYVDASGQVVSAVDPTSISERASQLRSTERFEKLKVVRDILDRRHNLTEGGNPGGGQDGSGKTE